MNFKNKITLALLLIGQALFAQNKPLALDPAVRMGKLPNGFTYYIRHNEEPKNRVTMYLANKVGSVLENEDQRGLAHFMEHMSFNGTTHFPKDALVDYLQKAGVRFGADINASTGFDETVYQLPLPSDNPELVKNGLQIMRDWAHGATLDAAEINKERGVVLEEKRLGKGASERMGRVYYPIILNHSRYADRLPIGIDKVLNNFKPATLRHFYQDWYRPNLQALIVVGDVNVEQIEKMVKVKFGDLRNPKAERARTKYAAKLTGKNQFISVTDKEQITTSVQVMIKHKEQGLETASDYKNVILGSLFNRMLGARYGELSRQADPLYISGSAGIGHFLAGLDVYSASVIAKPGELEKGLKAVWRETVRARRFGFTTSELERAKKNYLSSIEEGYRERNKTASDRYVNEYLQYFLNGTAAPGIAEEYRLVQADLPAIGLEDIDQLCKEYVVAVNRDILILAPDKDKADLPDQHAVESWLTQVDAEKLSPYVDEVNNQPFLVHEPIAGKVIKEEKDEVLHTTTLTLSNGVKVVLKPTNFKNDQVLFSAFAPGGTSLYSDAEYQSATNATAIILAAGVGNYKVSELNKYLAGKQAGVSLGISERFETVNGSSTTKDLETALLLTYARFTEPRKDKTVFDGIIARSKASLANRGDNPDNVFQDTVTAFLGHGNVRRTGPSIAKLEQIDLDRAFAIYQERFADASNFTFVFTGSFEVDNIKPLLAKYLGGLPATHRKEGYKDLGIRSPEGRLEKTVYKGTEPKATVNLIFSGGFNYSDSEKLKIDALKEVLQIRLLQRLREDESGVYSPGVSANVSKYPQERFVFIITFGCSPQNADKLIASALDEVNKLKLSGPQQVNVDKYKAEYQRTMETNMKTNIWWLSYLTNALQNEDDLHGLKTYPTDMANVTPESLKAAANKYLSGKNYIRLQLLPENAKP